MAADNEIIKAIKQRRSVRKYKPDPVPEDVIAKIAEAGTYAASANGRQPCIFIAVTDKKTRDRLSDLNRRILGGPEGNDPFYGAPAVLVVLADKSRSTRVYDGSLVMGNLMLAAYSMGLGSCWIHRAKEEFESDEGKEILASLGITGEYEGIGNCIVGYPDGEINPPAPRKDDFVYTIK